MEGRGFKRTTIARSIQYKIKDWLKTLPKELAKKVDDSYILTGGAITSMLLGEEPNDYDIYFSDPNVAVELGKFYIDGLVKTDKVSKIDVLHYPETGKVSIMIKSAGIASDGEDFSNYDYFESTNGETIDQFLDKRKMNTDKPYKPAMITSNAISLTNGIQIILRFVGDPEEIHKNFDFVHCTNYYTKRTGLVLNQPALEAILAKELRYVGSLYPICSLFRLRKFIKRGWTITAGEILKISWDVSKLRLDDVGVLQDQLIGVDVAYFYQIISEISKNDKVLDRTYLYELINRVFDDGMDDFVTIDEQGVAYVETVDEVVDTVSDDYNLDNFEDTY